MAARVVVTCALYSNICKIRSLIIVCRISAGCPCTASFTLSRAIYPSALCLILMKIMEGYWNSDRYSNHNMQYSQQDLFSEPPQTPTPTTQATYTPASMDNRAFLYDLYPNPQQAPYSEPANQAQPLYHFGDVQSSPLQRWDDNRAVQLPPLTNVCGCL
jgi:hypothetical protein